MMSDVNKIPERCDVVIAGAGFAGLALALALRQGLGRNFSIVIADPAFGSQKSANDMRASAIAAAARRLFETIGVWSAVEVQAQPILDMVVTDSRLDDTIRPTFLTFAEELEPGEPFAHMVENRHLIDALVAKARETEITFADIPVVGFESASNNIGTAFSNGAKTSARLLVAADGARSKLRALAGIPSHGWSYDQSGIVTTISHERDHHGRAEEHFLPAGPFAILPLRGKRSSIVWTEQTKEAERIITLPDTLFHDEVEKRFGLHLGAIDVVGPRSAHPLGFSVARTFIAPRLALVGDAAHVIHPIAGQGLNMGLRDIAALAEVVIDAARLGLDPGGDDVLERYQRWRRFDTMAMGVATDGLNRLFSNRSDVLRLVRDVGLGLVDRLPVLKRMFIREAAGLTGEVPKLLRGEMP
ncbi:MAG TPA: ubiquinone biosynthesis hydroxylase [Xanthobacteraceae bacterium]|jgi:2-octaprenyl-6-methoxyphenol hydroxylase|nr:ubiquinone biosynthesis hydroxylase [Xanthobacteraceae bacterium]